jgi:hypothetical protein
MSDISPDVSQYANTTLFNLDPVGLTNQAILNGQIAFPGWKPVETNTELVLIESLSLIIAELGYIANRLPGFTVSTLLQLFGIAQGVGLPATATVTFNLTNAYGADIPAGTEVQLVLPGQVIIFTTDSDSPVTSGTTSVTVDVTAQTNSSAPNTAAVGTPLTPLTQLWFVNSVVLATTPEGGTDPETNQAWLSRGITTLQGLNSTLVLAPQFATFALDNGAFRAYTEDNYDATTASVAEGVISTAVYGENGSPLTSDQLVAISTAMNAQTQANLAARVVNATVTTVPVTCTVMAVAGQDPTALQAAVVAAIEAWLSTDTWGWSATVRYNKLINVIEVVPGVDYVVSIATPNTDVTLTGFGPLAEAGTVTVTVDTP